MEAQRRRADPVDDPAEDLPGDVQGLIIEKLFSGDDPLAAGKAVMRWCARRKKSWGDEGMWRHAVEVGFGLSLRSVDGQLAAPPDFAGYWRSTFVYLCKGLRRSRPRGSVHLLTRLRGTIAPARVGSCGTRRRARN